MGTSLPCVLCRKKLDSLGIQWWCHIGSNWLRCDHGCIPVSKPTVRQRTTIFFKAHKTSDIYVSKYG